MIRTNHVGDEMIRLMDECGVYVVCSRDGIMGNAGMVAALGSLPDHPINRMDLAVRWLCRDDRFQQGYMLGHDLRMRQRKLKKFTLKQEFRPTPPQPND